MRRMGWFGVILLLTILPWGVLDAPASAAAHFQADDTLAQADALFDQGQQHMEAGRLQAALESFEAALPLYQEAGDREFEAACQFFIGVVRERSGDFIGAVSAYKASLPIWQEIANRVAEGVTLNNIGAIYDDLGQWQEALAYYEQALTIAQAIPDEESEAVRLNNIGHVYHKLGQFEQALDYYEVALAIEQRSADQEGEGISLSNIGSVYADKGQYELALGAYQEALDIARQVADRRGEGTRLGNIGTIYDDLEKYHDALERFQQALDIAQEIGDPEIEGATLDNMAGIYRKLAQHEQALARYKQALQIRQNAGDLAGQGVTLNNIGIVFGDLGQYEQALEQHQRSLAIAQEIGDRWGEAETLNNVGAIYYKQGQYSQALEKHRQALEVLHEIGDRQGETKALTNMGVALESLGEYDEAITVYEQAIDVIESLQSEIRIEELKADLAGTSQHVYAFERLLGLLLQQGYPTEGFAYAERARARAFLNQIGNQQVDYRRGAAPDLIAEEQALRQQIAALDGALEEEGAKPYDEQNRGLLDTLTRNLEQARDDHQQLITRLKLESPEYASLVSVSTLSLEEVQDQVLDEDTTLVEYFVLDDQTLAWVIDREGFELVALEIGHNELRNRVEFLRDLIAIQGYDPQIAAVLHEALFAPLEPHIHHTNLVIVPHGVLHYLPFAALWDAENERYLVEEYAVTYAPSTSVLQYILDKRNADEGRLLAMGNPDGSLLHSEDEAQAIAGLYDVRPLLGPEAAEGQVYAQAGEVDLLHLAAHGVYNPYNALYTRIELAADGSQDGNLEVHEVFGLDLRGANLVVLSACETALGEQSEGDELVGLTRAFLYAGTPAVVTTLWPIDDAASGALMQAFYGHLREGLTNAEALRAAQLAVMAQQGWADPYYWAAFSLTGDYRGSGEPGRAIENLPEPTQAISVVETPTGAPAVEPPSSVPAVEPSPTPRSGGGGLCGSAALPLGLVLLGSFQHRRMRRSNRPCRIVRS